MNAFHRLDAFLAKIEAASSIDTVHSILVSSIRGLGFDHFACSLIDGAANPRLPFFLTTYPDEWRAHYDRAGLQRHDPIFRHALRSVQPTLWSEARQQYGIETAERMVFGPSADFGLSQGGGLGAFGASGQVANLQVASNCSAAAFGELFTEHRHELQLLTVYTHDRVLRLVDAAQPVSAELTPRQREVLKWAMSGKTNWEIGRIMHIAEDTVRQHIARGGQALGATNRTQAVALAIMRGIIKPD